MDVRVEVGVAVQSGTNFPSGTFGVHGASGAFSTDGLLGPVPLATNCWPEVPWVGGGGELAPYDPRSAPHVSLLIFHGRGPC